MDVTWQVCLTCIIYLVGLSQLMFRSFDVYIQLRIKVEGWCFDGVWLRYIIPKLCWNLIIKWLDFQTTMLHFSRVSSLLIKIGKNGTFSPHMTVFAPVRTVSKNFLDILFFCWSPSQRPYRSKAEVSERSYGVEDNILVEDEGWGPQKMSRLHT